MSPYRRYGIALVLWWGLVGNVVLAEHYSASPVADKKLRLGWIGPLTGESAVIGREELSSVKLAVEEYNLSPQGKINPVELLVEDDQYKVANSLSAYHKLTRLEGVRGIIILTYGAIFALAEEAYRDGVVLLDTLDCNDSIAALPDSVFCLGTQTESIVAAFYDDLKARKLSVVALLVEENDPWMVFIAQGLEKRLAGIKVLYLATTASTRDYRAELLRARAAGAQALILLGNDQMGAALRQLKALGMSLVLYGVGSITSPKFRDLAGDAVEGAYVSYWVAGRSGAYDAFKEKYVQRFGAPPILEFAAIPAYDGARILLRCLSGDLSGSGGSGFEALTSCLKNTKSYAGVAGEISFDADGAVRSLKERLYQWHAGELRELK